MRSEIDDLRNGGEVEINEYTSGIDVYQSKEILWKLVEALHMKVLMCKDEYGNVSFKVERKD